MRSSPVFRLIGIGWVFVLFIVGGLLAGIWLDGQFDTDPIFTLVGLFLGLTFALVGGYQMLMETVLGRSARKNRKSP